MNLFVRLSFSIMFLQFFVSTYSNAQIFSTRSDVIKKYGSNYKAGITDEGVRYLLYVKNIKNRSGRALEQATIYYFTTVKNKSEVCHMWKNIEPSSETNTWVNTLRKNFVEVNDTVWKDYENNILYTLQVKDGFCTVQVEFIPQ